MHLEPGYYTIHNGDNLVGRSLLEDFSLNPKTVFNATPDTESIWQVERLPDGKYILRNFEAPVAPINGVVKAVIYPNIDESLKIFEWEVTSRHYQGKNLYTLELVTLKSGIYTIHNEFSPVGRASVEDLSLRPKAIYNATDEARSLWYIQAENNGKYKLLNLGAPVAAEGDKLFAFIQPDLNPNDPRFEWTVEPQFHQGPFLYTIVPFVLRTGFYKIRSNNDLVGRALVEDKSLLPKPILNKTDNPHATWFVQNVGPYRYKLSASQGFDIESLESTSEKFRGYDPVGVEGQSPSLVFAVLEPKFVGPDWGIIPRFEYGEDVYTIQLATSPSILLDRAWFAHEGQRSQIQIQNVLLQDPIAPNLSLQD
ncbi:hypothetical protein Clacol_002191 [Clathrus columnatus]|uniref:Ricin B lectin domain-containing protein n=1 Tax=Clathrus columnatus TaxID=1419009 RepID=A0AAV5A402_9AGAM|nr:hypothetical protein Clacol_002191 [Clathrus columnatus]